MDKKVVLVELLKLVEKQGYLTLDDIDDFADNYNLSLGDIDWLSSNIATRNILIYDEDPKTEENDSDSDYSQFDYDALYSEILKTYPDMDLFLQEVKTIKAAQYKEFTKLKVQCLDGNHFARNRMVETQIRAAIKNAWYSSKSFNWDFKDALSAAFTGLMLAIEKYDNNSDSAFPSYASYWMQQSLERALVTQNPLIYMPAHMIENYVQVYNIVNNLENNEYSYVINNSFLNNEIQKKIPGLSKNSISILLEHCYETVPLDDVVINTLINETSIEDEFIQKNSKNDLKVILDTLKPRERKVLELRFGLDDDRERTLEEVGSYFGVTRERIRQIEAKALRKLTHPSTIKKFKDLLLI